MGALQRFYQRRAISRRRSEQNELATILTKSLQGTGLARKLIAENPQLYKAVGDPKVVFNLQRMPDGTLAAWARDNSGRFIGQAKLKTVVSSSRYAKLASAAVLYVAMHEISTKLRAIEQKLDRIDSMLEDSSAKSFQQALAFATEALDRRDYMALRMAELPLRQSLAQQTAAFVRNCEALPSINEGALNALASWWNDNQQRLDAGLLSHTTHLQDIFVGYRTFMAVKTSLDGSAAAASALNSFDLNELERGLTVAAEKARQLEAVRRRVAKSVAPPDSAPGLDQVWIDAGDALNKVRRRPSEYRTELIGTSSGATVVIPLQVLQRELSAGALV